MWTRQKDLLKKYGNPSKPGWGLGNIVRVTPPFAIYAGKLRVHSIQINKDLAHDLEMIFAEIWDAAKHDQKTIDKWGVSRFDGSWVVRSVRGGKGWSAHAFAYAIDFDARRNPLGVRNPKNGFSKNCPVVQIFKKHGWFWGNDFKRRADAMHFSASGG